MDGVKEYIFPVYDVDADEFKEYIGFIRTKPELIRCKDCKWYGRVDKRRFYRGADCLQGHIHTIVPERDYCSRAELKESYDH